MSQISLDINGDKILDRVTWESRCDFNACTIAHLRVEMGEAVDRFVPIEELKMFYHYDQKFGTSRTLRVGDLAAKRKGDVDRRIYGFSAEAVEKILSNGNLRTGLQIYLLVEPLQDTPRQNRSKRMLGTTFFAQELFPEITSDRGISGAWLAP